MTSFPADHQLPPWGAQMLAALAVGHNEDGSTKNAPHVFNVKDPDYAGGACGDASRDDTAAVLAACTASVAGDRKGVVFFPPGTYKLSGSIPLTSGLRLVGDLGSATEFNYSPLIQNDTTDVFSLSTPENDMYIGGLSFYSSNAVHDVFPTMASDGSAGIIKYSIIEKCGFYGFKSAFDEVELTGTVIRNNYIDTSGTTVTPFFVRGSDFYILNNFIGCHGGNLPTGIKLMRVSDSGFFTVRDNFFTPSQGSPTGHGSLRISSCFNALIDNNQFNTATGGTDCVAGAQMSVDDCHDILVRGNMANLSLGSPFGQEYGYFTLYDSQRVTFDSNMVNANGGGTNYAAYYITNQGGAAATDMIRIKNPLYSNLNVSKVLVQNACTNVIVDNDGDATTLGYAASITPNYYEGRYRTITASNSTAFTVNTPAYPISGGPLTFDIANSSGGTMGAITFGTAFLTAGTLTAPANGKRRTIGFYFTGTNWVETNRAAGDI